MNAERRTQNAERTFHQMESAHFKVCVGSCKFHPMMF